MDIRIGITQQVLPVPYYIILSYIQLHNLAVTVHPDLPIFTIHDNDHAAIFMAWLQTMGIEYFVFPPHPLPGAWNAGEYKHLMNLVNTL